METMKAVIYEDVGKFSVKQVPVPKVEKGTDLLLRVDACSICGTDVHILSTPPGVDASRTDSCRTWWRSYRTLLYETFTA